VAELKVLAVEHDEPLRQMYESLLSKRGHHVETVSSGREALEKLGADIDVVVVDLRSHKSEGHELLEALGRKPSDQRPPVLIVDGDDESAALVAGPHTMVMRKPFDLKRFVESIEALARVGRPKQN
jgi:DNA-binding response OmpR family regulator